MNDTAQMLRELRIDRHEPPPRQRGPWLWVIAALLLVLGAGLVFWLALGRTPQVQVAPVKAIASAGGGGAGSVLDASGYVTARRQATVSSKITGKVTQVLIEEGMRVEEGQILAHLDPVDAQAQQALSESQLQAARTQLDETRTQIALAEKTLARQRELIERKLVSQSAYDQAESERDALRARLATAQRNVEVAQDSLALTRIGVDNTVVRAPFTGVVTVKAAQPGEMISPISAGGGFTRSGIATIVDMESLEVQVDVNEAFIGRVRPKQPIEAVLNAYPDWTIPGEVIAIVPTADRGKATVKVRIALAQKDERIVPEMGVRVSFLEARRPDAAAEAAPAPGVRVPAAAIVTRDGKPTAFVVQRDGELAQRVLRVGRSLGDEREVLDGLRAGENVVLAPAESLRDGTRVAVDDAAAK
jgi:RND family efflux transporter MFP subunit